MKRSTEGLGRVLAGMLIATAVASGLAACGNGDDSTTPPVGNPVPPAATQNQPSKDADDKPAYSGPNDAKFVKWAEDNEDAIVTLTGTVKNVVNDNAFTITGQGGAADFLVVSKDVTQGLTAGGNVSVTGVVHKAFDLPGVEDEIDIDFDDDNVFQGFDRDPYVMASNISVE